MPIRPIIEGETNWDKIDEEGSEPADIEFLEQFANEGGNDSRDHNGANSNESRGRVHAAETILENCVDELNSSFRLQNENTDTRIYKDIQGEIEEKWHSLQRLKHAARLKAPTPMPMPITEPTIDAYITEIRVQFSYLSDEEVEEQRCYVSNHDRKALAEVRGVILRYSDGTFTKTGDIRGTECRYPVILMMGEHITSVEEHKGGGCGEQIVGLSFYCKDENGINRHFDVRANERLLCEEHYMGEGITKEDSIIHTLKWCNEKCCIDGQTTRTAPICPNPLQTDESDLGRVAGYSFYPYENGRDRDYAWEEYVDNEEYVWENHVPPDVVPDIEKVITSLSIESEYYDGCHCLVMQKQ